jgi:UDP-glucose 4-epimerase
VHATRRRSSGSTDAAEIHWHDVDLRDADTSSLPREADVVVYLAQSEHFRDFPRKADDIFAVNVASVQRFLEYARTAGCRTFVLASSGGVYPTSNSALKETLDTTTRSTLGFYAGSKLCAEILAEQYVSSLTVVILRFFFVYGPGQPEHMLLPRLVRAVSDGVPLALAGRDGIRINPTYVDDAARAVERAVGLKESQRINVAGPEVASLREIGDTIGEIVGREPVYDVNLAAAPQHLFADVTKMRSLLGAPTTGVREGVSRLVASMHSPREQT